VPLKFVHTKSPAWLDKAFAGAFGSVLNEAIQLYQGMEAPKQVEKVEKTKRENIDSQNLVV
jgi:hypothetical protein